MQLIPNNAVLMGVKSKFPVVPCASLGCQKTCTIKESTPNLMLIDNKSLNLIFNALNMMAIPNFFAFPYSNMIAFTSSLCIIYNIEHVTSYTVDLPGSCLANLYVPNLCQFSPILCLGQYLQRVLSESTIIWYI